MSSAVAPARRRRKMATMIARPTATSAAATTSTKNTIAWPLTSFSALENATKVRLTALSMSSTHMNITRTLRRTSRPTAPITNRNAASVRYHAPGTLTVLPSRLFPRGLAQALGREGPAGQNDGADHGDHEQHR